MRIRAAALVLGFLVCAGGSAHAASGQRAGCLFADIEFRRPVTLHVSTSTATWSVPGRSSFVVFGGIGQPLTVDEDTETWVTDANGSTVHQRLPLGDDKRAARWRGNKILVDVPKELCTQGVGWYVIYK